MSKHVLVLMGGWSAERAVSLSTGEGVARALAEKGYRVTTHDVGHDLAALLTALEARPDVVFNALHGRGGEDGVIQGVLDTMGVPYTHSGVLASAVAMDKAMTKRLLETAGVRSPKGVVAPRRDVASGQLMELPFVVKPINEGSSVGVTVVRAGDNRSAVEGDPDQPVLVEPFIPGRDLFVTVMGDRPLAVTEVRARSGLYDYDAKYTEGLAEHFVPAPIPQQVYDEALRMSLVAHQTLGCRGVTRSDFRWDETKPGTTGLYFLEINTQPGMTPLSLVPEQAAYVGIAYADLCAWMVEDALCRA